MNFTMFGSILFFMFLAIGYIAIGLFMWKKNVQPKSLTVMLGAVSIGMSFFSIYPIIAHLIQDITYITNIWESGRLLSKLYLSISFVFALSGIILLIRVVKDAATHNLFLLIAGILQLALIILWVLTIIITISRLDHFL